MIEKGEKKRKKAQQKRPKGVIFHTNFNYCGYYFENFSTLFFVFCTEKTVDKVF